MELLAADVMPKLARHALSSMHNPG